MANSGGVSMNDDIQFRNLTYTVVKSPTLTTLLLVYSVGIVWLGMAQDELYVIFSYIGFSLLLASIYTIRGERWVRPVWQFAFTLTIFVGVKSYNTFQYSRDIMNIAVVFILVIWVLQGWIWSSDTYNSKSETSGRVNIISNILVIWGSCLQVSAIILYSSDYFLEGSVKKYIEGLESVRFLSRVRMTSPWFWTPSVLILLGAFIFFAYSLSRRDFTYTDYEEFQIKSDSEASFWKPILGIFLFPLWVLHSIWQFLRYVITALIISVKNSFDNIISSTFQLFISFVIPIFLFFVAHEILWNQIYKIKSLTYQGAASIFSLLLNVFLIHLFILCVITLYVIAFGLPQYEVVNQPISESFERFRKYTNKRGYVSALSMTYSMGTLGVFLMGSPIAVVVRGAQLGPISYLYISILIVVLITVLVMIMMGLIDIDTKTGQASQN